LGGRHIKFQYDATFGDIVDNTIEQLDLENMDVAVGLSFTAVMQTKTVFTSGLDDRHIYYRYNATSGCASDNVVELDDIENMDVGV